MFWPEVHSYSNIQGSRLKIAGVRTVTWGEFHTKDPQLLGVTLQDLVAQDLCASDYGPEISSNKKLQISISLTFHC